MENDIFSVAQFSVTYFHLNFFSSLCECSPLVTSASLNFNPIFADDGLRSHLHMYLCSVSRPMCLTVCLTFHLNY